jgi:hypothetical protein
VDRATALNSYCESVDVFVVHNSFRLVKIRTQSQMWTVTLCYHAPGVPMENLSAVIQQLKREHHHLQQQLQRIDEAIAALGSSSNGTRKISAEGRLRISLAQKARWAKTRTAKPKRTISAAGRRRIAAAQRARWAKMKRAA